MDAGGGLIHIILRFQGISSKKRDRLEGDNVGTVTYCMTASCRATSVKSSNNRKKGTKKDQSIYDH